MTTRIWLLAAAAGILVSLALFWLMQAMIAVENLRLPAAEPLKMIDFVRLKQQPRLPPPTRRQPPKPPEKEPPPPKLPLTTPRPNISPAPDIDLPPLDIPLPSERLSGSLTAGISVGPGSQPSGDVIPLAKFPPRYPVRAQMRRIEGWVKVEFTITEDGSVKDAKIVEAHPPGVFDSEALRAIRRWKFKPKEIDGRRVEQRAVQILEFKLQQR